jgi:cell shape-determining protein MreC
MTPRFIFTVTAISFLVLIGIPEQFKTHLSRHAWIFFSSLKQPQQQPFPENKNDSLSQHQQAIEQEKTDFSDEQALFLADYDNFYVTDVIYHPRSTWHHSLWINGGSESTNLPFPITKNCPVVADDILIGVIDYVGAQMSQVRLISDPNLHPSVRVVRQHPDTSSLAKSILHIQKSLNKNCNLMPKPELTSTLNKLLDCLYSSLPSTHSEHLAKGELQGSLSSQTPSLLKGVGFNYEFDDEEGERRDLRTGQSSNDGQKKSLLLPGDSLETSGLDGIFPKGLKVALILQVFPLEEGAISYSITAESLALSFPDFEYVSVLPAQSSRIPDAPSISERIQTLLSEEKS